MGIEELKRRMEAEKENKPTTDFAGSSDSPRPADRTVELQQTGGVSSGQKSIGEKDKVAEQIIERAKANDVEDTREETTEKGTRHDLVAGTAPNIPPTIQQERMKQGLHPITGEPWTPEEHRSFKENREQERINIARDVKQAEEKMRHDVANPPTQPITHTPTAFLTEEQRKAIQQSQDAGESPARQAQRRDAAHPDEVGRKQGENMTDQDIDNDVEQDELDRAEDSDEVENDDEPDADEVEESLNKK